MKYFNDKMDSLLDSYVSGMIHEIVYLRSIKTLVNERLDHLKEENNKIKALLEA